MTRIIETTMTAGIAVVALLAIMAMLPFALAITVLNKSRGKLK